MVRERVVGCFAQIDTELATRVGAAVGVIVPTTKLRATRPDAAKPKAKALTSSPALSMESAQKTTIATRKIAILAEEGVRAADLISAKKALAAAGAVGEVVSGALGTIKGDDGTSIAVDKTLISVDSVLYDAGFIPGGKSSILRLTATVEAMAFVTDAFKHFKAIGATGDGGALVEQAIARAMPAAGEPASRSQKGRSEGKSPAASPPGVVISDSGATPAFAKAFAAAIARRHWARAPG